jgi:hypothetical protein
MDQLPSPWDALSIGRLTEENSSFFEFDNLYLLPF